MFEQLFELLNGDIANVAWGDIFFIMCTLLGLVIIVTVVAMIIVTIIAEILGGIRIIIELIKGE